MPRYWYDWHDVKRNAPEERKDMCFDILAEKKPYFMKYIYPDLGKKYNTYIKSANRNALREFRLTIDELKAIPKQELTEEQDEFLKYYEWMLPVYDDDCVTNKICHRFEEEFDNYFKQPRNIQEYDYTILKSGTEYTERQYRDIKKLYDNYNKRLRTWSIQHNTLAYKCDRKKKEMPLITERLSNNCSKICSNQRALCDLLLDMCYKKSSTKRSVWSICSHVIVDNLLKKHNNTIQYPTQDPDGDISFKGYKFSIKSKELKENKDDDNT